MKKKSAILATICTASMLMLCACENDPVVSTIEDATEASTEAVSVVKKERLPITVTLPESNQTFSVGDKFELNASYEGDGKITYKSSNEDVAVVSTTGVVNIINEGTAYIRVDAPGAMYQRIKFSTLTTAKNEDTPSDETADNASTASNTGSGSNNGSNNTGKNNQSSASNSQAQTNSNNNSASASTQGGYFLGDNGSTMAALINAQGFARSCWYPGTRWEWTDDASPCWGDASLDALAQQRAKEIAQPGCFNHSGSQTTFENIGMNIGGASGSFGTWMNSTGHRQALDGAAYGCAVGFAAWVNENGTTYSVFVARRVQPHNSPDINFAPILEDYHNNPDAYSDAEKALLASWE